MVFLTRLGIAWIRCLLHNGIRNIYIRWNLSIWSILSEVLQILPFLSLLLQNHEQWAWLKFKDLFNSIEKFCKSRIHFEFLFFEKNFRRDLFFHNTDIHNSINLVCYSKASFPRLNLNNRGSLMNVKSKRGRHVFVFLVLSRCSLFIKIVL